MNWTHQEMPEKITVEDKNTHVVHDAREKHRRALAQECSWHVSNTCIVWSMARHLDKTRTRGLQAHVRHMKAVFKVCSYKEAHDWDRNGA
jgi:hypothetical protein